MSFSASATKGSLDLCRFDEALPGDDGQEMVESRCNDARVVVLYNDENLGVGGVVSPATDERFRTIMPKLS